MQLLRVASTMSYQGSPYSGPGDEYDFEDDGYDDIDEYRDQDEPLPLPPVDDSDEDTEEASETDIPNNDEPLEIKEQMYLDKLANLKKQLQQLEDGIHPEYLRRVKRLEQQLQERLRLNRIYKDHMHEVAEREYVAEKKAAAKEFEEKKIELRENLLNDLEDKRKMIENERHSMELNTDSTEVKPVMKRILRRRANEPPPAPEKRRKPLCTALVLQLDERDVDSDLRAIRHAPRKHYHSNTYEREADSDSRANRHAPRKHQSNTYDRDVESDSRANRHTPRKQQSNTYDRDVESDSRANRHAPRKQHSNTYERDVDNDSRANRHAPRKHQSNTYERDVESDSRANRHTPRKPQSNTYERDVESDSRANRHTPRKQQSNTYERDVDKDSRANRHTPRKQHTNTCESPIRDSTDSQSDTRVEDGKLLYERRWFHRGQSVYVEGRELPRFAGNIHAITDEAIWVKKANLERVRIYTSQLARGKVTLKRRAS